MNDMKKFKKVVSLVLAVALVLSIVGPFTDALPASAADGDGAADWVTTSEALTVTGDAEKGYNLSTTAEGQAALLKKTVDFNAKEIRFTYKPEDGKWAYLYFQSSEPNVNDIAGSFTNGAGGPLDESTKMTIRMTRNGNDLTFSLFHGWADRGIIGTIQNFDWEAEHTIGFVDCSAEGDANWYLKVDDTIYKNATNDAQEFLSRINMSCAQNGGAYVVFGVHDNKVLPTAIKVVSNSSEDWVTTSDALRVTGNAEKGYNLSTTAEGQAALLKKTVDFNAKEIRFTYKPEDGKWAYLYFQSSEPNVNDIAGSFTNGAGGPLDESTKMTIRMTRNGNDLTFSLFHGWADRGIIGTIQNFDWEAEHTIGFVDCSAEGDANWYLKVDDTIYKNATNDAQEFLSRINMSCAQNGGAYVVFGVHDNKVLPTAIKVVSNSSEDWVTTSDALRVTGNAEKGYNLSTTAESQAALLKKPVDFNAREIRFTYKPEDGKWAYLYFQSSEPDVNEIVNSFSSGAGGPLDESTKMTIRMTRNGNDLTFSLFHGWADRGIIGTIQNFDWEAEHTIGFVDCSAEGDANWYLKVDDTIYKNATNDAQEFLSRINMSCAQNGGAYVVFGVHDNKVLPTAIKLVDKDAPLLGNTATLNGTIDFNYYMKLDEELQSSDVSMKFTYGNGIEQKAAFDANKYDAEKNAYIFTCKLPAKHMADEITARLYKGENPKSQEFKGSVNAYGKGLLDGETLTGAQKTLVKNMLHYGAYAQEYFNYNTGNFADAGLSREDLKLSEITQQNFATTLTANDFSADGFGKIAGANLHLDSETELRVYLKLDAGVDVNNVVYKCGEIVLEGKQSGDYVIVTIPNIAAHQLQQDFAITATSGNNTYTLKYSVFQYAYNALGGNNEKLNNLMRAMYRYNEAALAVLDV